MALPAVLRSHWTHRYPRLQNAILAEYLNPVSRDVDLVRTFADAPKSVARTGVAGAVGYMSYKTSKYRQKPIVGLRKAEHRKDPVKVLRQKVYQKIKKTPPSVGVDIPTVSSRRTKSYSKKILHTSKAMPYRRTYKRKSNTRSKKGRRSYRKRRLPPLAIPRSKVVRFRYLATGVLNGAGGAIATQMIKANDLNDPTGALSTVLPLSLDQWAAHYQKYIVLGSKLKVRFGSTTNTGPGVVGIHLDDDNTALTSVNHYKELPMTKQRTLTTQKDYAEITLNYSGKKFWRLANIKDDSEQEGAFSTTPGSPTDIAYYHVFAQDFVNANNFVVDFQIEHEFIVYLTEPVTLAQSSL